MKYRKKPVVIEAIKFTGKNPGEIIRFCDGATFQGGKNMKPQLSIRTLEGVMIVSDGDYVIKGVKGEFYPCKPEIFEMTYEMVEE